MKSIKIISFVILALLMLGSACKEDDPKSDSCKTCDTTVFIQDFKAITGVVKMVNNDDYVYNGNQFYLLLDTETQLPEFFSKNPNQKFIKLFSCSKSNFSMDDMEKTINISGKLYNCTTGNHGRPTNDIHTFQIFN